MTSLILALYLLIFFCYIAVALFILFHIFRYSLKRSTAIFSASLFSLVFIVLMVTNFILFTRLPFSEITSSF
ncbi:MAG: hypothetical protein COZ27_01185 [Candidatus Moranbacteria bacterium CG_4_10_14_3_um_filter_41_65]|nr:MAG: hypothetical protein AUK58_03020 [Candidatus Moranbacteria bacterium CG2_30_41_165]PIP25984.1 MAG: hypothetical protein COX32_00445 [Candidatus Moranbacteria bacterium CG23_combo_of_CG06-09_8_20_14_all_41_28]PIV86663.1 MAG: hypothetical protein COW50_00135 [Candidatus Moranbacteria bacterium CG17_big_fil_post_rev_8_21_14_2_50_41_107]PIW94235.1 MAG: hypothetical protein COZ86_02110 [Candidatus Moranbacteria bacterium CG_4_8_14_3_um_filter_41_13]PIX91743.1 MAG: hypothetical protein COZ27_